MTPTQREAALRLADDLEYENQKVSHDAADLLRELAAAPQGEPAAWFYRSISGAQFVHFYKNTPRFLADQDAAEQWPDAHSLTPLYTHPPQQRKPLTEEQVYEAISDQVFWATSKNFILRLVRDIERANGIGAAP